MQKAEKKRDIRGISDGLQKTTAAHRQGPSLVRVEAKRGAVLRPMASSGSLRSTPARSALPCCLLVGELPLWTDQLHAAEEKAFILEKVYDFT